MFGLSLVSSHAYTVVDGLINQMETGPVLCLSRSALVPVPVPIYTRDVADTRSRRISDRITIRYTVGYQIQYVAEYAATGYMSLNKQYRPNISNISAFRPYIKFSI